MTNACSSCGGLDGHAGWCKAEMHIPKVLSPAEHSDAISAKIRGLIDPVEELESDSRELGQIRDTLIVVCRAGKGLYPRGFTYDETKSVLVNLVNVLTKLTAVVEVPK